MQSFSNFLMSSETELLAAYPDRSLNIDHLCRNLFSALRTLAPTAALHGASGTPGLFHAYGKTYLDQGHLELAAAEADSPYQLIQMMERQRLLLRRAISTAGIDNGLVLSNCNHSGRLAPTAPTWGCHENYLIAVPPESLRDAILPFLATRLYTGSGGVSWPDGTYLANSRALFLKTDTGGGTTESRSVHSTARRENLTAFPDRYGYRYHLIFGDGVCSQYSMFLRVATTAIVLKALEWLDSTKGAARHLFERFPAAIAQQCPTFWTRSVPQFNSLSCGSHQISFLQLALRIQRHYLSLCDEFSAAVHQLPEWVPQALAVWDVTLSALERNDYDWLSRRLDVWIKHRLITRLLESADLAWEDLKNNARLHDRIALFNQQYHDQVGDITPFRKLEHNEALNHRVISQVEPGDESTPFVPRSTTRAMARANFLREHSDQHLEMDWSTIVNDRKEVWRLDDPFGEAAESVEFSH